MIGFDSWGEALNHHRAAKGRSIIRPIDNGLVKGYIVADGADIDRELSRLEYLRRELGLKPNHVFGK